MLFYSTEIKGYACFMISINMIMGGIDKCWIVISKGVEFN